MLCVCEGVVVGIGVGVGVGNSIGMSDGFCESGHTGVCVCVSVNTCI